MKSIPNLSSSSSWEPGYSHLSLEERFLGGSLELPESQDGKFAHAGLEQVCVSGPGPVHMPGIAAVLINWKTLKYNSAIGKAFPLLLLTCWDIFCFSL